MPGLFVHMEFALRPFRPAAVFSFFAAAAWTRVVASDVFPLLHLLASEAIHHSGGLHPARTHLHEFREAVGRMVEKVVQSAA